MRYKWINKASNRKVIIFFNGWGVDEEFIELKYDNYDFIVFYGYRDGNVENSIIEDINSYDESYIIAWSMGVLMSNFITDKLINIKKSIAINGTLKILNNEFGIAEKIFQNTLDNLTQNSFRAFMNNMFFEKNIGIKNEVNIEILKKELEFIKIINDNNDYTNFFTTTIIGARDIIVPFKRQKKYWEVEVKTAIVILKEEGHFPFYFFKSWGDILSVK